VSKWILMCAAVALAVTACAKRKEREQGKAGPTTEPSAASSQDPSAVGALAGKAAAGDLDGDGRPEIVLADATRLRVLDRSWHPIADASVSAGIEVLVVADVDGDGKGEILAGWGRSREWMDATVRITLHRLQGNQLVEELVSAPRSGRQDVAAIVPTAGRVLLAYFANKYEVRSVWAKLENNAWSMTDISQLRMATSYAIGDVDGDGQPDLVVGRVYGEDQEATGDAFVLRPDGTRTPIPTTRGVRGLAITDLDGDGKNEIYLGDGWDKNYGQVAQGLLTRSRWDGAAFQSELIENTEGQFTIWKIIPADVDGDGRPELVTQGPKYARAYRLQGGAWQAVTFGGANPKDMATASFDDQPGEDVLLIGVQSAIVSLHDAKWAPLPKAE
jgi:hypothetical protein